MFNNKNNDKIKKSILLSASTVALMASLGPTYIAQAQETEINADASITIDYETGQILQGETIDEPLGIASMTKMIVEYIVFEEIETGNVNWDTEIKASEYAHRISQDYNLSNVPLRENEAYTLQELYNAMAIYSANGATIAIAEAIEGSEEAFVDRMRNTVESFGVEDAELYNSTGLNNSFLNENIYPGSGPNDENIMSARSVGKIANRILTDYSEVLETASIPKMTFREGTVDSIDMINWNTMLEGLLFERPGVDGLKTGRTEYAGSTFTGTAKEEERRIITVLLNSGDDLTTRFTETDKMMDYGFDHFNLEEVTADWNEGLEYKALSVVNGKEDQLNYEPSEELEMLIQLSDKIEEDLTFTIEWDKDIINKEEKIEAPVSKGMELGRLVVSYSGNELGYLDGETEASVPLVAKNDVEKAGIFGQLWNGTANFFQGLISRFN